MRTFLWVLFVVIAAFWLFGVTVHLLGSFIHFALVAAVVLIVYNLFFANRNRRRVYDYRTDQSRDITKY